MSKKIIFDDKLKNDIIQFIKDTYQCTISDVSAMFNVSKHSIKANFDAQVLNSILFHGVKDSTKKY